MENVHDSLKKKIFDTIIMNCFSGAVTNEALAYIYTLFRHGEPLGDDPP